MKFLTDIFTENDGASFCMARLGFALGVLAYIGLSCWTVIYLGKPFDMQGFGIGLGATLGAGGAGIAMKAKTES